MDERLALLAQLSGIELVYRDGLGIERRAETPALVAVLAAMGVAADSPQAIEASIAAAQRGGGAGVLPPVRVLFDDETRTCVSASRSRRRANSRTCAGRSRPSAASGATCRSRRRADGGGAIDLPLDVAGLGWGYHRLTLWHEQEQLGATRLVVAPRRCYLPERMRDGGRVWGLTAQLYALRSPRNWGIGDFTDLRALVETAAAHGASVVGINPLHALFPHNPRHCSPYSPSSRLFLNTLYVDVERVLERQGDAATQAWIATPEVQARLRSLRDAAMIDYAAVAELKREVLEAAYAHFRRVHVASGSALAQAFRAWCVAGGDELRRQGLFEALQEHFFRDDPGVWGWPVWPVAYRDPAAPAVQAFARDQAERVEFYLYLQWQADDQLGAAARRSRELGLGVGLYADLAVSVDRAGAETWANQALYAVDASVGAPPDPINLLGQDWGLPPLIPGRLQQHAYAPWIAALRASMKHAGALRIDHVMALMRLYWVPPRASAGEGVYVRYPFDDLLGILALESQRNRCLVIGEDLGTVPAGVRERLAAADVLSYRLMYFERAADGAFQSPPAYPRLALAAVSTHDLPTLAGWWLGRDLRVRAALGHFPSSAEYERQMAERAQDRARLLAALAREGLLPPDTPADAAQLATLTPALCRAVHQVLARSPALVVVAQVEDVLGVVEQANLPGTTDEHPNWRRRLPDAAANLRDDARLAALARMFAAERPPAESPP